MQKTAFSLGILCLAACQSAPRPDKTSEIRVPPSGAQAVSLLEEPLFPPPLTAEALREREEKFAQAKLGLEKNPGDPDAAIWVGRRSSYLGKFREAVAVYSDALGKHPENAKLLRHRGHRFITLREFGKAISDLEKAAKLIEGKPDEPEPDGTPNAKNAPSSTLHSNIWYHLGLAHYLSGDFAAALRSYRKGRELADTPDRVCSSTYWLYNALRRAGLHEEAKKTLDPIHLGMDVSESHGYYKLLLVYKGLATPDSVLAEARHSRSSVDFATVGYGIGNWHLCNGREEEAKKIFLEVLKNEQWPAFGRIGAEVEFKRRGWSAR